MAGSLHIKKLWAATRPSFSSVPQHCELRSSLLGSFSFLMQQSQNVEPGFDFNNPWYIIQWLRRVVMSYAWALNINFAYLSGFKRETILEYKFKAMYQIEMFWKTKVYSLCQDIVYLSSCTYVIYFFKIITYKDS